MEKENQIEIAGTIEEEETKVQLTITKQKTAEIKTKKIADDGKRSSYNTVDSSIFDRFTSFMKFSEEK